jgi:ABC-2 type transport system ATP-binding protein
MIATDGLTKLYGDFAAVRDLSFAVRPGEVLGLVGPNGAGKTTALRCLSGIIPPTKGTVIVAGVDMAFDPLAAKRQLAFFPDEPRLFDYLTVRQHLEFTGRLYNVADIRERTAELLGLLELTPQADQLPAELSRGMKQKVGLACGFLHRPQVMFFDEPLTGLDPLAIRRTKDIIVQQAKQGVAILISSHLLHLLEEVCSHVLILRRGEKIAYGTLNQIREEHTKDLGPLSLEEIFIRLVGESDERERKA